MATSVEIEWKIYAKYQSNVRITPDRTSANSLKRPDVDITFLRQQTKRTEEKTDQEIVPTNLVLEGTTIDNYQWCTSLVSFSLIKTA